MKVQRECCVVCRFRASGTGFSLTGREPTSPLCLKRYLFVSSIGLCINNFFYSIQLHKTRLTSEISLHRLLGRCCSPRGYIGYVDTLHPIVYMGYMFKVRKCQDAS